MSKIEPKLLKGFRDTLPAVAIPRQQMIRRLEDVFSSFGFVPIDTPALEYAEILLGKGSEETDRQMYRFEDNGGRKVALRFDLTVPLARFAAMYVNELGTPFKRYHIAPVWRAEKPQRGRYREFIQCDFDIIGTTSELADAEIVCVVNAALSALDVRHQIRINNRNILSGFLEQLGALDRSVAVLRAIDKIEKIGQDGVREELLRTANFGEKECEQVFTFLDFSARGSEGSALLNELERYFVENERALKGVKQLRTVFEGADAYGIHRESLVLDLSIARGLDYYTGTVVETRFLDLPHIGSICSGGRYDDLASLYTSRKLPGVGASVGLDRILGAFEELERFEKRSSTASVLVTIHGESTVRNSISLAAALRKSGIATELSPEPGGLGGQIKYADRKGIRYVVILGEREAEKGVCTVKDLTTSEQRENIALLELPTLLRSLGV